jgi:prepilin-type N-terminal cleavage/methylation domain-containing protein
MNNNCKAFRSRRINPGAATGRHGFTIVELMIALVLSGFVMTMVFYSWNYISNHTITQQRRALFQTEADRIAQTIVFQIRKSPEVLRIASTSIAFLSPDGVDTIVYEFVNGSFRKNNRELWSSDHDARIIQFSIEQERSSPGPDTSNSIPLLLTIGLNDRFGNASVIPLKVRAIVVSDDFVTDAASARAWNF